MNYLKHLNQQIQDYLSKLTKMQKYKRAGLTGFASVVLFFNVSSASADKLNANWFLILLGIVTGISAIVLMISAFADQK